MKNIWISAAACAALGSVVLLATSAPVASADKPRAPVKQLPNMIVKMPLLRLDFSAHGLVLSGMVPNAGERNAVVARAQRLYSAVRVIDLLEVGTVANPSWLDAAYLPDLRGAIAATAVLSDATLVIDGNAESVQGAAQIAASTLQAREAGLTVLNRLRVGR